MTRERMRNLLPRFFSVRITHSNQFPPHQFHSISQQLVPQRGSRGSGEEWGGWRLIQQRVTSTGQPSLNQNFHIDRQLVGFPLPLAVISQHSISIRAPPTDGQTKGNGLAPHPLHFECLQGESRSRSDAESVNRICGGGFNWESNWRY